MNADSASLWSSDSSGFWTCCYGCRTTRERSLMIKWAHMSWNGNGRERLHARV